MAANVRTQRGPKRSWAFLNDIDNSNPSGRAFTSNGERKRKRGASHLFSARKRTKKVYALVEDFYSRLTGEDVRQIFVTANISFDDYEFLVPSKSQRANTPPQGYISVYEEQINAGLRFPLHDMIVRVCDLIQVSPSQLAPNAYRVIVGFILCAKFYDIPLTEASFLSLVKVMSAKIKGLVTFRPDGGCNFLVDKPLSPSYWKKKFFFLRRKGISWNCITEWNETFSRPTTDALLAEAAIKKGILNHRFRVNELTSKEILIHGGIQPGVPSPEFTFRSLMQKAAVTKFDLLSEDEPPTSASAGRIRTIGLKMTSSTTSLAAHTNPLTLTASAASLAQPRDERLVNHQQLQSTPDDTEIPPATETPICEHLPVSFEDNIPLHDPQCKAKKNQESGSHEGRMEANSTVPVSDEAEHEPIPPGLLTLWQSIESKYVPKDCYQELEKGIGEISSELTYAKWEIQELKQELELSEARGVEYQIRSYAVHEAMKSQSELIRNRDSELAYKKSRIQELEGQLELSERKRADFEKKICLANEDKKKFEKMVKDKESRTQELVLQLEVSEAKRADSEKKIHLANKGIKEMEKRTEDIHITLDSKLESTKSQIQELKRELEKLTCSAYEDIENLEKRLEDSQKSRDSELADSKSQIQELERALAISEAKRKDSEKKIGLANEDKKNLEKRIEYERNRARDDAVEEFKSSAEFLNMVQEKAYEVFDIKHLTFH